MYVPKPTLEIPWHQISRGGHHQLSKFAQPPGSWVALHFHRLLLDTSGASLTAIPLRWNLNINHLYGILRGTRLTITQRAASWLIRVNHQGWNHQNKKYPSAPQDLYKQLIESWSKSESPGAGDVDIGWFSNLKTRNLTRKRLKMAYVSDYWMLGHHSEVIQIVESIDISHPFLIQTNIARSFRRLQWVDIWSKPHFGLPNCTDDLYFHYINTSKQSNTIIS